MKHMLRKFSSVALLLGTTASFCSAPVVATVTPYYSIRPQGVDAARELVGWTQHVNLFDMDKVYGTMAATIEYARSFRPNAIAGCLLGTSSFCNTSCAGQSINVTGSRVASRGASDLLADYFYLPTDFSSTLRFTPRIQNVVVDLDFYVGLDEWVCGLFFRAHAPINWTRWQLNMCETNNAPGTLGYDPGYFNGYMSTTAAGGTMPGPNDGVPFSQLNKSFAAYAAGQSPVDQVDNTLANPSGVTGQTTKFDALCFAKINNCKDDQTTRLAELAWILGWNFVNDEDYHLGVGLLTRAPTGNRPEGIYLFEPISGNGKHWELGAHITGHAMLWRCEDEESSIGFYVDANITHLFKAKQRRTFDLVGKPLSRYMLAEKFAPAPTTTATPPNVGEALAGGPAVALPLVGGVNPAGFTFAREFAPVANITTQEVRVSVGVQGDVAAQFTYANGGFNWDLGYNFWGRSCEKIACCSATGCSSSSCPTTPGCNSSCNSGPACVNSAPCSTGAFTENTWALKGDAYVVGFDDGAAAATFPGVAVNLSASESLATINAGTNFTAPAYASTAAALGAGSVNPNIDNAQLAFHGVGGNQLQNDPSFPATTGLPAPLAQTRTSIQPLFITKLSPAATGYNTINYVGNRGISNKLYTHLSYNWTDCEDWVPYVGVGGFGEWGNSGSCNSSCSSSAACPSSVNNCSSGSCGTSSCLNCALSQWGVWVKFGLSFN